MKNQLKNISGLRDGHIHIADVKTDVTVIAPDVRVLCAAVGQKRGRRNYINTA